MKINLVLFDRNDDVLKEITLEVPAVPTAGSVIRLSDDSTYIVDAEIYWSLNDEDKLEKITVFANIQ